MKGINCVLVLAPHPDDGEFGCGGTLKRFYEEGVSIWYVAFSPCIKSLPPDYPENQLFNELEKAADVLGIPYRQIKCFNYEVREFPRDRQKILENLILLRKEIKPDLILLPNSGDIHQDHHVIYEEGVRAFKMVSMLGYELPWNNTSFNGQFFIRLDENHIEAKNVALAQYESQKNRGYKNYDFIRSLANVRGVQAGNNYAEAFEMLRWYL